MFSRGESGLKKTPPVVKGDQGITPVDGNQHPLEYSSPILITNPLAKRGD